MLVLEQHAQRLYDAGLRRLKPSPRRAGSRTLQTITRRATHLPFLACSPELDSAVPRCLQRITQRRFAFNLI